MSSSVCRQSVGQQTVEQAVSETTGEHTSESAIDTREGVDDHRPPTTERRERAQRNSRELSLASM
eukprot:4790152-Pyramimonas_sp.AAC.2